MCCFEPEFAADPIVRPLLLHPIIDALLEHATGIPKIGRLKADLEAYVSGKNIVLELVPRQHRTAYMGRLDPISSGTWDIRSRDPSPGIRVFGAFAATNVFVALGWRPRSRAIPPFEEKPLGDDEIEWQIAMLEAEERWQATLPNIQPIIGDQISDYVSENVGSLAD